MLDGRRSNFVLNPSCHPSSYMNLPIFTALGNLTAYIPSPLSSPWTSGFCTPRHVGPPLAPLGRILSEKIAFQENFKNIDFSLVFQAFLSPRPAQHPTKCAQKLAAQLPASTSEDGLTYQGYLGPSWPRFWRVLGSTLCLLRPYLAPTWLSLIHISEPTRPY